MKGFASLDDAAKSRYALPLRLTPAVARILIVVGLALRHLFQVQALPATPTPRRFSYIFSNVFLAASALSFHFGWAMWGLSWEAWWLSGPPSGPLRSGAWGRGSTD